MSAPANAYEFPPYRGITLKIIGDITGNYNSNATFASEKEDEIEDFRTMLNIGLGFQYKGKRRVMGFSGLATRQLYNTAPNIQNPSEELRLNYSEELTKYDRISLHEKYTHTQEPGSSVGDFDIEQCRDYYKDHGYTATKIETKCNQHSVEFGRYKGRFDSYTNDFSVAYIRALGKAYTLKTNYGHNKNWSDEAGTNDSDRNSLGLTTEYKHSEATRFSLSYRYQVSDYDRGNDIIRQSINVGIGQSFTKNAYINANIGKTEVSSGNDSLSLGVTLRSVFDEKTSGSLSYSQGVEVNANTEDTFENWQTTGSLSRYLLEDLQSSLSAFYGKGDYSFASITDKFVGASVNFIYNFWQGKRGSSMKAVFGYQYSDLSSSSKGRGYTRDLINTKLTIVF